MAQADARMQTEMNDELDLIDFAKYVLRKWKIVALAAVAGVLAAAIYVFMLASPVYEATAQLYVVNSQDSVVNLSDLQIGSYLTADYQRVFDTWEVNQLVIDNLGLPYNVSQMRNMVSVTNPSSTRVLLITVSSTSAKEAALIANEFAAVSRQYISDTMLTEMPTVLSVAQEPLKPTSPKKGTTLFLGLAVSMMLAVLGLFAAYYMDDKIKTASDVRKYTGASPLAIIPFTSGDEDKQNRRW